MRRIIPIILLSFVLAICLGQRRQEPPAKVVSHQGIDSLFVNAPANILPLLSRNARLDMIDYLDYSQPAIVSNRFGGKSEMTTLSDSLIEIRLTDVSTWQMRIICLPQNRDTIIQTTHIVCRPDTEIVVNRYTRDWQILSNDRDTK